MAGGQHEVSCSPVAYLRKKYVADLSLTEVNLTPGDFMVWTRTRYGASHTAKQHFEQTNRDPERADLTSRQT